MASSRAVESAPPDTARTTVSDEKGSWSFRHSASRHRPNALIRLVLEFRPVLLVLRMLSDCQTPFVQSQPPGNVNKPAHIIETNASFVGYKTHTYFSLGKRANQYRG